MTQGQPQDPAQPDHPASGEAPPRPPGQGPSGQVPPGQDPQAVAAHWPSWRRRSTPDPWEVWLKRAEHTAMGLVPGIPVPAWLRSTRGEQRWPISLSVIAAIVLQVLLPPQYVEPLPRYLLPMLEGALLIGLTVADPVRVERGGTFIRAATIVQIVLITAANALSAGLLIRATG